MKLIYTPGVRAGIEYLASAVTRRADERTRVTVIIPDQMAVTVEDALSRTTPAASQLYFDVLSFRRLAETIFRTLGGISYNYADEAAETVVMWRALMSCRDSLAVYGQSASPETAKLLLSAVTELKQSMISPDDLMRAAIRLSTEEGSVGGTAAKCMDVANIYEAYDELLGEAYDDRRSALGSAVERIRGRDFFAGTDVIVFAFSGFTAQQMAMIREAAGSARECEIVFTVPGDARLIGKRAEFDGIAETRKRLLAAASEAGVPLTVEIIEKKDETEIDRLVAALFASGGNISDERPASVKLIEALSRRGEAEAVAIEISRAVRDGARYRDIAICVGSVEPYRGIIDEVFASYSIPLHMSSRTSVEKFPETAALFAALRVITGGWRSDDVAAYIKTGMTGLDPDSEDELLMYLSTWSIGGRRFYDPDGGAWSMNPSGYTTTWTEEDEALLSRVNGARKSVTDGLLPLAEAFSDETDAGTKTEAVRAFLAGMKSGGGDEDDGGTLRRRLAEIISGALSAIELSSPPGAIGAQDYISCLRLVTDVLSVGNIPGRTDEVEISTTIGMRGAGHKTVIMLGVADGELPASGGEGFFTESERQKIAGAGVEIGESAGYRASMELYNFCRCAADASEKLILTYRRPRDREKESIPAVIDRIREIYPAVETEQFAGVLTVGDIYSEAGAVSKFTRIEDAAARQAVIEETESSPSMRRALSGLRTPISTKYASVSPSTAEKLFGGDLYFSQAKLESAVSCRFGFYCSYILGLRERRRAAVRENDVGTFIHAILENIFSAGLITRPDVTDAELEAAADGAIGDYASALYSSGQTARQRELFARLRRSVLLFLRSFRDEFSKSRFRPVLFEVPFGMGGVKGGMPPLKIELGGGTCAYLRGIADRVDTYRDGEGRLYIRVVDYKSGHTLPSPDMIPEGHGLQLPLYLYTFCSEGDAASLGGESGDVLVPAGFLYVGVRPSDTNVGVSEDEASEETRKLPKKGLLLADESVLRAQDSELKSEFIPVSVNKDGSFGADSAKYLATSEDFGRVYGELLKTVGDIAASLRAGSAETAPAALAGGDDPCEYCAAKPVCRRRG